MLRKNEGFSLVEVLVAIVILSIIVLPIINYFINSIGIVHQSGKMSQAVDIANDTMEIYKSGKLDEDLIGAANTNLDKYEKFAQYQITVVESDNGGRLKNVRLISVKVKWDDNVYELESIVRVR